jgi:hypothetical protein
MTTLAGSYTVTFDQVPFTCVGSVVTYGTPTSFTATVYNPGGTADLYGGAGVGGFGNIYLYIGAGGGIGGSPPCYWTVGSSDGTYYAQLTTGGGPAGIYTDTPTDPCPPGGGYASSGFVIRNVVVS